MHILDRLSKDLAELMERELAQAKADLEHLYFLLLLLVGGQRRESRPGNGRNKPQANPGPLEAEEADGDAEEEEDDDAPPANNATLSTLLRQSPFTHGNPYPSGLLFRDFHAQQTAEERWLPGLGTVKIHAEAALYVEDVLWLKTLGLATRNAGEELKTTKLHQLLLHLCRLSRAAGPWADTDMQRHLHAEPVGLEVVWFRKTAIALRGQAKRLHDRVQKGYPISVTASNRREASGPYWLEVGGCAEVVGEELSLGDVAGIVPTPLHTGFAADPAFLGLLRDALQSLNERYKCLRACGLPPQDWLHRDEPSINRLEDLALLRKRASQSDEWINGFKERAFHNAFETVRKELAEKDKKKKPAPKRAESDRKVGGFAGFKEWLDSGLGQTMLRDHPLSLSGLFGEEEDFAIKDQHPEEPASEADASELYAKILAEAGPRLLLDPVLAAFFREVLVADRPFPGQGGLLEDPGFQALLAQTPGYAGLASDALAERLFYQARSLVAKVLQESADATAPELVLQYLHWVLIQEKPRKALFKQKAFQAALAQDPVFRDLPEDRLADSLHGESLRLLARWLGGDD